MSDGAVAPLLINDARADPAFTDHPAFRWYGIQSYIAVPLMRRDGSYFGTLCAFDPQPTDLTEESFEIFHLLANLIAFELEADEAERRAREVAERLAQQSRELTRLEERERIGRLRTALAAPHGRADLAAPAPGRPNASSGHFAASASTT